MAKRKRKLSGFSNPELITEAMDNGVIIRLDPLEYPIFMLPGGFARNEEEKQLLGSAAFSPSLFMKQNKLKQKARKGSFNYNPELFMKQNKLAVKPRKAEIRRELKNGIKNMALTLALLTHDYATDGNTDYIMGPSKREASSFYTAWKKKHEKALEKCADINEKDAFLVRAYARSIQDLAPYVSDLSKLYKKNKKSIDSAASIKPASFKSKSAKKAGKSSGSSKKTRLTAKQVEYQARKYNKGDKRGKFSKLKSKLGKSNADRIIAKAQKISKK